MPRQFAQQPLRQETRPRRANDPVTQQSDPAPRQDVWKRPATPTPVTLNSTTMAATGPEPTIRVALATDVRSGSISTTTGQIDERNWCWHYFRCLRCCRVRVEPRLFSPLPRPLKQTLIRIKIEGAESRDRGREQRSREIRDTIDEDSQITFNSETTTWGLLVGTRRSREGS